MSLLDISFNPCIDQCQVQPAGCQCLCLESPVIHVLISLSSPTSWLTVTQTLLLDFSWTLFQALWTLFKIQDYLSHLRNTAKENWVGEQCNEIEELWGRTTVRGHTNSWKTLPLWNKGKLLPSKIVQEKASQKNKRYLTNGQNTALNSTITRPMDSHQYWTVQTDTEDDHSILHKEVEAAVQSLKKRKSAWVDDFLAELVQSGWEGVITALTTICNKI